MYICKHCGSSLEERGSVSRKELHIITSNFAKGNAPDIHHDREQLMISDTYCNSCGTVVYSRGEFTDAVVDK